MKSKFFLTFKDPQDMSDFTEARNPEIILISSLLLIQRVLFWIVLLINFLADSESVDARRLYLSAIGKAIHIVLIGTLFCKKVYIWQIIHAPIVMLSYLTFLGNSKETTEQG